MSGDGDPTWGIQYRCQWQRFVAGYHQGGIISLGLDHAFLKPCNRFRREADGVCRACRSEKLKRYPEAIMDYDEWWESEKPIVNEEERAEHKAAEEDRRHADAERKREDGKSEPSAPSAPRRSRSPSRRSSRSRSRRAPQRSQRSRPQRPEARHHHVPNVAETPGSGSQSQPPDQGFLQNLPIDELLAELRRRCTR